MHEGEVRGWGEQVRLVEKIEEREEGSVWKRREGK